MLQLEKGQLLGEEVMRLGVDMCVVRGEMEWTRTRTVGGRHEAQLSPSDRAMRLVSSSTYTTSPDQIDGMKLEV